MLHQWNVWPELSVTINNTEYFIAWSVLIFLHKIELRKGGTIFKGNFMINIIF